MQREIDGPEHQSVISGGHPDGPLLPTHFCEPVNEAEPALVHRLPAVGHLGDAIVVVDPKTMGLQNPIPIPLPRASVQRAGSRNARSMPDETSIPSSTPNRSRSQSLVE